MGSKKILVAMLACLFLAACGLSETTDRWISPVIRGKENYQTPIEPEPDVAKLVRDNPNSLFVGQAYNLKVSHPRRSGYHWEACAEATVANVAGQPSEVTVVFPIEQGRIGTRDRVASGHWCTSEAMAPI